MKKKTFFKSFKLLASLLLIFFFAIGSSFFYFFNKKLDYSSREVCGRIYQNNTDSSMHSNYLKEKLNLLSKLKNFRQHREELINFFPNKASLESIIALLYEEGIDYFRVSCSQDEHIRISVPKINKHIIAFPCERTGVQLIIEFHNNELQEEDVFQVNSCI